jgi:hypothetical protein
MLLSPTFTGHCQGQLLWVQRNPHTVCLRGYHPLFRHIPVHFGSSERIPCAAPATPHPCRVAAAGSVWAVPLSLAATDGISIDFSSSSYSDASLRTVRPPLRKARECKRETSFGNPGIDGRMHLPQAYRSLPRPSSLIKPSHPPTGVFAPVPVRCFFSY